MDLETYFPNGAPKIWATAFEAGYGDVLMRLGQGIYFGPTPVLSPIVIEAAQLACLMSCDNRYCAVMHARGLVAEGMTLEEVKHFARTQSLPARYDPDRKWAMAMRAMAIGYAERRAATNLAETLSHLLNEEELEAIRAIIAFSLLHQFFLDHYADRIKIDEEPMLFKSVSCGRELISFFTSLGGEERPVSNLCSVCSAVKTKEGWQPIHKALSHLPRNALFTHGFCPPCLDRLSADSSGEE